jgi:hypothetical protein
MPEPVGELTAATEEPSHPSIAADSPYRNHRANSNSTNNRIDIDASTGTQFHLCNRSCTPAPVSANVGSRTTKVTGWFPRRFAFGPTELVSGRLQFPIKNERQCNYLPPSL